MSLVIASGGTTSGSVQHRTGTLTIFAPAALTGTVKVETSVDSGATWTVLQSGGSDITVPAGKATQVSGNLGLVRVKSGGAEGATRTFELLSSRIGQTATSHVTVSHSASLGNLDIIQRVLSSEEILALSSSAVTLVQGQAGKVYLPLFVWGVYNYGTVPYTSAAQIRIGDPDGAGGIFSASAVSFMDQFAAASQFRLFGGTAELLTPLESLNGYGLKIYASDTFADGDGTLDVTVLYKTIAV